MLASYHGHAPSEAAPGAGGELRGVYWAEPMWADVSQQLSRILSREVFDCLVETPSYTYFLEQAGLKPPLRQYLRYTPEPFPDSFAPTCAVWAHLIAAQVKGLNCLVEDKTLRAEVIHGPAHLYRCTQTRQKPPEPQDLRRNTNYFGDWWFDEPLLKRSEQACAALEAERLRNPLLTAMKPDACLKTQLRRRMAVSVDWNTIGAIRELVLASNESLPVITGLGKPMPYLSDRADWRKFPDKSKPIARQTLPGGDRQIWLIWTPQKHSIRLYKVLG